MTKPNGRPRGGKRPGSGRPRGSRDKRTLAISEAFEAAAIRILGGGNRETALDWLVQTLMDHATKGESPSTQAAIHLGERLLGKVPQPLQHTGAESGPITWEVVYVDDESKVGPRPPAPPHRPAKAPKATS